MGVNPLVVQELRSLFKTGATPSALIRRITERHPGEPRLDQLVRAYFREAFHVPMIRVGPEQVRQVASGGSLPILNVTVTPRMIQARREWDVPDGKGGPSGGCWLDEVPAPGEATRAVATDPKRIPELAGSWDRLDDEAQQFVRRLLANSHALHENVKALATLAEQLQNQLKGVTTQEEPVA